ncbi:hypothetical protein [Streptomyces sp. NBC_01794]|uniref:hypothetical protein n=1 Tax=Streptomyces sp. NBC_01794 TaxID=2975942 RepID=UPI003090E6F2|nr:hypothetical protein OIE54_41450 [Streptomyces sp. NBC_01794]
MPTASQLQQFIRFGLDTLGERNAHHDFETLSLAVARRRIASNLLPATGPVSTGGDQGRDAESYFTRLHSQAPEASAFARLASNETIVLACTIQRRNVAGKIRNDIASICSTGTPVHRIAYFTVAPVPVSTRHDLQEEALAGFQVAVDVFDSLWLAQELAEPDLFHLAETYLQVPSEFAPAPDSTDVLPDWYLEARTRWREQEEFTGRLGEFALLRRALRHATFNAGARSDLADWLDWARRMLQVAEPESVRPRLQYEIAVAHLRGLGDLTPADPLVQDFFDQVLNSGDLGLLQDAQVLLNYVYGSWAGHTTALTAQDLERWTALLSARVRSLLEEGPPVNRRASLHALAAQVALRIRLVSQAADYRPEPAADRAEPPPRYLTAEDIGPLDPSRFTVTDLPEAMAHLQQLCDLLPQAQTFPVVPIADAFDLTAPLLAMHAAYPRVRQALDEAVERTEGGVARARKSRNRALQFLRIERPLEALGEVHSMKVSTWFGDTLPWALKALLMAGELYGLLHLPLAAKQCALAVCVAAGSSQNPALAPFIAQGLLRAADYDYQAGNLLTSATVSQYAITAQGQYVDDPWNEEEHDDFQTLVVDSSMALLAARQIRPHLVPFLTDVHAHTGLDALIDDHLEAADVPARSEAEWMQMAVRSGCGRLFADEGPRRTYHWAGGGPTWQAECENTRQAVLACERFVAAAQILIAKLAPLDPLLQPAHIHIDVQLDDRAPEPEQLPDNHVSRWRVYLAPWNEETDAHAEGYFADLAAPLMAILIAESPLPQEQFMHKIRTAFEQGLNHKLIAGRAYDELADLLPDDHYDRLSSFHPSASEDVPAFRATAHPALDLPHTSGPGYDEASATEAVRHRYEALRIVRYTMKRLAASASFRATALALRDDGWRDWHILNAVLNIMVNHRLSLEMTTDPTASPEDIIRRTALLQRPETEDDPAPPDDAFTRAALKQALATSTLSTLQNLGLESHRQTPNFPALIELLGARYAYWTLDVPHEDFLMLD